VQSSNIKAALLVMVAMSMITTNDAIVKHLTQAFGIGQIMLIRGLLVCIIFAAFLKASNIPVLSKKMFHRWNIIRGLLELGATAAFLTGLSMLPLATASSLGFSSPIFLAVLAAIFLKEKVGWGRWLVIFSGFVGVLMITNPFAEEMNWAVVFPVTCAIFVALRDLAIRYVPDDIPSMQIAFTNAWIVTLGGAILTLAQGWSPVAYDWYIWFPVLAAAIFCGYISYIVGTRMGELSFIGPFKYTSVVLAIILGYLIWDEAPTPLMLTGVAVIVLSGIALLAGEKRRLRRKLAITPLS
jgi:drug/metabolite transporter (DMT)-like permease